MRFFPTSNVMFFSLSCIILSSLQPIDNQKLGLCEALLNLGDWDHAKQVIDRLPGHSAVSNQQIAKALCLLVSKLIDPLYRRYVYNVKLGSCEALLKLSSYRQSYLSLFPPLKCWYKLA